MPVSEPEHIRSLLKAMREQFFQPTPLADEPSERERQRVAVLLEQANKTPLPWQPSHHPVVKTLPLVMDLLEHSTPALAHALALVGADLPWRYSYDPRPDHPGLEQRMAWTEVVGPPQSLFLSHEVSFGLTLIAPHTLYPSHFHPAVELYHVVAGTAEWQLDGRWSLRPPGSLILHPNNAEHAMRTGDEPLLALYSWSGEVETLSDYKPQPETLR
jgi:quercetin dioxygenase-like cupin family protein